jgi:DNA-binding beta-propeller fold protein YncE
MKQVLLPCVVLSFVLTSVLNAQVALKEKQQSVQMRSPTRIATMDAGTLLVTDYELRAVLMVKRARPDKAFELFSIEGRPLAIGVMGRTLYVGNETTRRVEVYDRSGTRLGTLGGADYEIGRPSDLAVDPDMHLLFVVDGVANVVRVFDISTPEGTLVRTISAPGFEDDELLFPAGIAVNPVTKEVFVSDYGDSSAGPEPRILIFDYDGVYQASITGDGGMLGYRFSKPQGIAVNDQNQVFVAEAWGGQIIVVDRDSGDDVKRLGTYGTGEGELYLPLDLVIAGPGKDVFVTNNRVKRIEVFGGEGQ